MSLRRFVLISLTVVVGSAWADVVNIDASERGWVCSPGVTLCGNMTNNGATPGNDYLAGAISKSDGSDVNQTRNWFEFAIPTLTDGTLTSATLNLDDSAHVGGDLTYSVYGLSGQPLVFSDVTTGSPYGSVNTTDASSGMTITITLDAAALAAIGADQGGDIFIGGIDSAENDSPCAADPSSCVVGDFAGGGSDVDGVTYNTVLTLTTTPSTVPEPSTAALLVTMILLLAGAAMWRRKALAN
jgi:hypothetical protein